ncbi:CoA transferase [Alphaproteobacteria bacterium]|nr:CoA transferase [Alphaproteobacteria bacterium]
MFRETDAIKDGKIADKGALSGIKVLDLTRYLSGPQTTLFLGALGAEVLKIDNPHQGDPVRNSPPFFGKDGVSMSKASPLDIGIAYLKRARSKKSIELDLKSEDGISTFMRLAEKADVIVENFRVGVTKRLKIDYEQLKSKNPKIIYCSITGFGATGPDASKKAFDATVQAASGLMSITGEPDGLPMKIGSSMADTIAGTFAFSGILASLFRREKTGLGEYIDVSMTDCLISLLYDEPWDCFAALGLKKRQGNRIMRFSPFNCYAGKDGTVVLGAASEKDWISILRMIGQADLQYDDKFSSISKRIENNSEIDTIIGIWTSTRSVDEIARLCENYEIPCHPVNDIAQIADWKQIADREILTPLPHPYFTNMKGPLAANFPIKFSGSKVTLDNPAPKPNEHFKEIMESWLSS